MPNHTTLASASGFIGAGGGHHLLYGGTHRMKLVVTRHLFDQGAVILKQDKKSQVVQQISRGQHAAHQSLQLLKLAQRVQCHAVNGAPLHESLGIGRERAHARLGTVRDHQQLVVGEHIGHLVFVSLNLVVGLPDVGIQVCGVLQLNQHQRQTVDEQNDVGPARMARPLDGELLHRQPLVALGVLPVDQAHIVAPRLAVLLILHRHTRDQHAVKRPVARQQRRLPQIQHLLKRVFAGSVGHSGVESVNCRTQTDGQYHLAGAGARQARVQVIQITGVERRVTDRGQPAEGFLFELVFSHDLIRTLLTY